MKNKRGFHHDQYDPDRKVSFGKHIGMKWKDVPLSYLLWFSQKAYHQMANRKDWALKEIERRKQTES